MFNGIKEESENDLGIRNRKFGETTEHYIEYLSSLLKYIKEESLKSYLLDIINSLKSQQKILSENGKSSIIHDINGALKEEDEITIEKIIGEKLIYFKNLLRSKSKMKSTTESDPNNVVTLREIIMAHDMSTGNAMGQKNRLQDVKIGDIITVSPETVIYDNSSLEGVGTSLSTSITKNPFIVDSIIYYKKEETDGLVQWIPLNMSGNIQEVINDYDMLICYNPGQYCKICHICQCTDGGQIIPSGINGYIHNCEYKLLNVKEEDEELDFVA